VAATVRSVVTARNATGSGTANSAVTAAVSAGGVGSGGPGGAICSPSPCVSGSLKSQTLSVDDGSSSQNGGTVTHVSRTFQYSAPSNLVLNDPAHPVPLVFEFRNGQQNGEQTEWLSNSGPDKYAVVYYPAPFSSQYAMPDVNNRTGIGPQSCGPHGTSTCDDIPAIQAFLHSVECIGALPCMNVSPSEVYFTGGSGGGTGVEGVMCDDRTSALGAAYLVESNALVSPVPTVGASPNCPALGQQCLWAPSCTGSANTSARIMWVYGTAESPFNSSYCSATAAHDCIGVGYKESGITGWFDGAEQLAGCTTACATPSGLTAGDVGGAANIIGGFLGCPAAPSATAAFGTGGQLTYRDHQPCSNGAETATISAYGGPHLPNGYDALDVPKEGWAFMSHGTMP
jgi:poly(3-hydroxybutyrate) depolymerase